MTLRQFHVDGNITDAQLVARSNGFLKNFVASFRQAAANGNFTFGPLKFQDSDLNRVHAIVTEIDSRRLFYVCSDDEHPRYAMESLYEARKAIRESSKGVWANPTCEALVQEITSTLNHFCTQAERMNPEDIGSSSPNRMNFYSEMADMRLKTWLLVAMLKKKLGSVLSPRNLPKEIWECVENRKV